MQGSMDNSEQGGQRARAKNAGVIGNSEEKCRGQWKTASRRARGPEEKCRAQKCRGHWKQRGKMHGSMENREQEGQRVRGKNAGVKNAGVIGNSE